MATYWWFNPNKNEISIFLDVYIIESKLNALCLKYENIVIMGDFNSEICEERVDIFCNNFKNLVKEPTCFKSIDNPSCH